MSVSYLFTPILQVDALLRNKLPRNQVIVLDLEDSIHTKSKTKARSMLESYDFNLLVQRQLILALRVNPISSPEGIKDIELLLRLANQDDFAIRILVLPKINSAQELALYQKLFATVSKSLKFVPIIETLSAVEQVDAIAALSDGLIFGQADLESEMYAVNTHYITNARAKTCIAAAKFSIPAIDTPTLHVHEANDTEQLEQQCIAAKAEGFVGKVAIHPKQIPSIDKIFAIKREYVLECQSLLSQYENAEVGFSVNNAQVVAPPFIAKAKKILEVIELQNKLGEQRYG